MYPPSSPESWGVLCICDFVCGGNGLLQNETADGVTASESAIICVGLQLFPLKYTEVSVI